MALTLPESAKMSSGDVVKSAVIEQYARTSDVLRVIQWQNIMGNAIKFNREGSLGGIGFRGVNEAYTESSGILTPMTEPLVIAGGDLDVDNFIIDTQGASVRSTYEMMKVKALALAWTKAFIKGDSDANSSEFDGLQERLVGDQLISSGSTQAGDPLSLLKLDELIDAVNGANYLIMNKTMRRLLTSASRLATVGGTVTFGTDEFGKGMTMYNGLPILIADEDETGTQILPFTEEADTSGGAASSSIYCVNFEEGYLNGIQANEMAVKDLGELDTKPVMRTRIDWYNSICIYDARAAARLYGISNTTVTV